MNRPISEDDVHAYADGQLDLAQTTQVETWLASYPEYREKVSEWRAQSAQLHGTYDVVLNEPIPPRLMPPANQSVWFAARRFAAVAWLILGTAIGFFLRGEIVSAPVTASLPRLAAVAHAVYAPEVRHPVEVGADQEAHLIAWLSKRLGTPLKPPRLDEVGYQLVGGRLLSSDQGEVAQFMYENARKSRLTLYVQPQAKTAVQPGFRYANEKGIDVFYWMEGQFGYALAGNTGRDDMLKLANIVYQQHVSH
jgi:anti-sigma factor RsiW